MLIYKFIFVNWIYSLEHPQQMWDMCQMLNIWHIFHTKHQKLILSNVPNLKKFAICEQYHCKFAMVRTKNGIIFIVFLFCFLSPLSSVYSFLFSLTSVFSPLFSTKNGINLHRLSSLSRHHRSLTSCILHRHCRSLRASSSSSPIRIDVGIDVEVRSECSSRSWALTLRSWSWASTLRWGEILIVGCQCKWIRGFGLAMLVVLWVFFAWVLVVFFGFELLC